MKLYWQPGVTIKQVHREVVIDAYRWYRGNKTQTASSLGVSVRALFDWLKEYKIIDSGMELEPDVKNTEKPQMSMRKREKV